MRSDLFERRSEKRFAGVRRAGLSHYKVAKPAHAMLNIAVWQGGCAPLRTPSVFRAAAGTAGWRSRRWPPPSVWIPMHISRLSRKSHKLLSYNYLMSTYRIRFPLHFPFAYGNPFDPSGRSRTRGGAISTRDPDCHERHDLPGDMLPNCL